MDGRSNDLNDLAIADKVDALVSCYGKLKPNIMESHHIPESSLRVLYIICVM